MRARRGLEDRRIVSKRMLYVELDADGVTRHVQYAPYLDYRPLGEDDPEFGVDTRPARVHVDRPGAGEEGGGLRGRERGSRASGGGPYLPACADHQDRGRGQGPPHQGDQLLGPSGRGIEAPGAGRQDGRPSQFGRGPQTRGHAAGAPLEAAGGAPDRSADLASAAGRSGGIAGRTQGVSSTQ